MAGKGRPALITKQPHPKAILLRLLFPAQILPKSWEETEQCTVPQFGLARL